MRCRNGFTLIELLVVIAIIAVLAAIMFPIYAAAKENGRKTWCMTHGREIGSAFLAYVGDWNNMFPKQKWINNYYGPGPGPGDTNIEDLLPSDLRVCLGPYIKNKRVWECLSLAAEFRPRWKWDWQRHTGWMSWMYRANDVDTDVNTRMAFQWDPIGLEGRPYSFITRPTKKCAVYDFYTSSYAPHLGGTVLLYVDGHVRWHKLRQDSRYPYPWPEGYEYAKP